MNKHAFTFYMTRTFVFYHTFTPDEKFLHKKISGERKKTKHTARIHNVYTGLFLKKIDSRRFFLSLPVVFPLKPYL